MVAETHLRAKLPRELCKLDLEVGYYPGPHAPPEPLRELFWHQRHEGWNNWNVRVFETAAHIAAVTSGWTPDILVAHWHGERRTANELPMSIAQRLGRERGEKRKALPFLVGQFSIADERFVEDDMLNGLLLVFDMLFQRPSGLAAHETLLYNIAVGLHSTLRLEPGVQPLLPFDEGFAGFLPSRFIR